MKDQAEPTFSREQEVWGHKQRSVQTEGGPSKVSTGQREKGHHRTTGGDGVRGQALDGAGGGSKKEKQGASSPWAWEWLKFPWQTLWSLRRVVGL